MPDDNHYLTRINTADLPAIPGGFTGRIEARYLDHPGGEQSPNDIDPSRFTQVAPEQARYLGMSITDPTLPAPLLFGIHMGRDSRFIIEQANEIANGFLETVANVNKDVGTVGLAAAAQMHKYVGTLNEIHAQNANGADHPHISKEQIGLLTELGGAFDQAALELSRNGVKSATAVWKRELSRIQSGRTLEAGGATQNLLLPPSGNHASRHSPDSDLPNASGQSR